MSKLRVRIDYGYTNTPLDITLEAMAEDVATDLTAKVLELLTEACKNVEANK